MKFKYYSLTPVILPVCARIYKLKYIYQILTGQKPITHDNLDRQ